MLQIQHSGPVTPTGSCLTLSGQRQIATKFRNSAHELAIMQERK
uniref:Uncharacterized protein n=1 Tax=Arundo donax TaxID=35708 RepID=A0A0A9B247_ARUDO